MLKSLLEQLTSKQLMGLRREDPSLSFQQQIASNKLLNWTISVMKYTIKAKITFKNDTVSSAQRSLSPYAKKDISGFSAAEAKRGKTAKGVIVKVLSNKGTLDPLDPEKLNVRAKGRKGSGFRRAITADIDDAALHMIPSRRKTIPKAKLRVLPFHSEIVDDAGISKNPLVLVLQCEEEDEEEYSSDSEKYMDTSRRIDRLMVQVIDTITSEESHFVVNMREFSIFYEELREKYDNMSPMHFDLHNRDWWKAHIRKFIVIKPRKKKTPCDCKTFFFKVSKSAIERHVSSEIQKQMIAIERERFSANHAMQDSKSRAALKADLAKQLVEQQHFKAADAESSAFREAENARILAEEEKARIEAYYANIAAQERSERRLFAAEEERVVARRAFEAELKREELEQASLSQADAESRLAEEYIAMVLAKEIAEEESRRELAESDGMAAEELDTRAFLAAEVALAEQQPESEEDYDENDGAANKDDDEDGYDAFDEDNKSADYSNDLDQEEDEPLARSNQEDLSNLDMTMTGFFGDTQEVEGFVLLLQRVSLSELTPTADFSWAAEVVAVLSLDTGIDTNMDDTEPVGPEAASKPRSLGERKVTVAKSAADAAIEWDALNFSISCSGADIQDGSTLTVEIYSRQEDSDGAYGTLIAQAVLPTKKLYTLLGSDVEVNCPLLSAAAEYSADDMDNAESTCGFVSVNAKLIPVEPPAPQPFEQGFLQVKSISVVGLKSLSATSIDLITPFVQLEVNGFSTRTSVSPLLASTAIWSDLSIDAAVDASAIKSKFIFVQVWSSTSPDGKDDSVIGVALIPLLKSGFVSDVDVELTGFLHSQQGIYCGVLKLVIQLIHSQKLKTTGSLESKSEGKVMDVYGQSRDQGAKVVTWDYHGGLNQVWTLTPEGYLESHLTGFVLDIAGWSEAVVRSICCVCMYT